MALGGALGPDLVARDAALMALSGALGRDLVARDAAVLCVAGVALGDIHLRFTWQAWHNLTSMHLGFAWQAWHSWHCMGGALGPGLVARDVGALCVAGVAQSHIHLGFAWQAWQAWHSWRWRPWARFSRA